MSGLLQALAVWVGLSVLTAPFAGRYMRDVRVRQEAETESTPIHDALWCEQREGEFS